MIYNLVVQRRSMTIEVDLLNLFKLVKGRNDLNFYEIWNNIKM